MNTTFELNQVVWGHPDPRKNEILECQGDHLRQFHSQILAYSLFFKMLLFTIHYITLLFIKKYIYSLFFRTSLFTNHKIFCSSFTLIKNFRPLFINHYTPSRAFIQSETQSYSKWILKGCKPKFTPTTVLKRRFFSINAFK